MSEIGDDFKFLKELQKKKRADNTLSSTELLKSRNVKFESKNNGAHLIVTHGAKVVDFWPATGRFISRSSNKDGRGVYKLFEYIGAPAPKKQSESSAND
jgi:hypothetical protein